jgi:hypothetical protein
MKWFLLGVLASVSNAAFGQSSLFSVDPATGQYSIRTNAASLPLAFYGSVGKPVRVVPGKPGRDSLGSYEETIFGWDEGGPVQATVRAYAAKNLVWFRLHYLGARSDQGVEFPRFEGSHADSFGPGMSHFSYEDRAFSPFTKSLAETSTPWIFFEPGKSSFVISPASGFMVAKMIGDGENSIGRGLNVRLKSIPSGYDQDTVLAYSTFSGVGQVMSQWGAAMRSLYNRKQTNFEADILLQKFGYWTDNGADYYYNYDPKLGYAGTLVDLKKRYDQEGIPISYLQLDSWWYPKTVNDPSGRPGGATKNSKLPAENWNRYGGLLEYRASPDLFPRGLSVFDAEVGVPLAVHNRWIDATSQYRKQYKVSGVGAVDPRFWSDVAGYLKANGVTTYEQDWLSAIYANSPEMSSTVSAGDEFAEGMANACAAQGLTMQYCMATPRFFLEGVKFPNLTTIRTSDDRFDPRKWPRFLFESQLATSLGIAPWCDVFKSGELGNMTVAVLSCGPVGTGDAIGKENIENIHKAAMPDGTIVKPDFPLQPTDETYADEVSGSKAPFVATAETLNGSLVRYWFAFARKGGPSAVYLKFHSFRPYVLDMLTGEGKFVKPGEEVRLPMDASGYAYAMEASASPSGIVLLGDLGKLVPTGHQRISRVTTSFFNGAAELGCTVRFSKGESSVTISGVSPGIPAVSASQGSAGAVRYNEATGRFDVDVHPAAGSNSATIDIKPSRVGR